VTTHSADLHIRADEPAADGHFPGNPIVPAAVLLREVLRALAPDREAMCCEIRSARFFRPVRPGDRLTISWDIQDAGDTGFTCSTGADGHRVLSGMLCMRTR
jgi:3-hydroxymyristoyl/3-hydroxydecanoyl-(acyl carrier protein) dehydratase